MNGFHHSVKNEQPALTRLFKRTGEDLLIDTLDFDVHLDCGDAALGARNGKVQAAAAALLKIGIDDILPVNIADADRAYGAGKGSFADGQRN